MNCNGSENWNYIDNNYNNNRSRSFLRLGLSLCKNSEMVKEFELEYVSFEDLYQAYIVCRKKKRRSRNAVQFELNWHSNLYTLYCELNSLTYKVSPYTVFCVDKPVKREVFAADFRDRIVHHLIINKLNKAFEDEFITDSYSCRVGKGTDYAVKQCYKYIKECSDNYAKQCWVYKADFKSFFMTIDRAILLEKLDSFILDKMYNGDKCKEYTFYCWLIKTILFSHPEQNCNKIQSSKHWDGLPYDKSLFNCQTNYGLPIGNLTSQIFANFYLSDFDHWVVDTLGFKYYGRYVDDFFIISSSKEKILKAIPQIKEKLLPVNVMLHPKKCYLQEISKGIKFVGSVIKPNRVYIGNRLKSNAFNVFKEISNTQINACDMSKILSRLNSYLGFMKGKATFKIRRKLCKKIENSKLSEHIISVDKFGCFKIL